MTDPVHESYDAMNQLHRQGYDVTLTPIAASACGERAPPANSLRQTAGPMLAAWQDISELPKWARFSWLSLRAFALS